jgi:CO dehydrogenase/acetyl-CoA synthase delta subunit
MAAIKAVLSAISSWWGSMSWTVRIQLIAIIIVAVVIFVQYRIIVSNGEKIATLETTVSNLKLDAKLQEIQTKIDNIKTEIKTNADAIAANQVVINGLRVTVYKKYKPDPNMKAATIVDGFKALQNETP